MSAYYATHAGLLRYVADDFSAMAVADAERGRELELYAEILRRMIDDLAGREQGGREQGGREAGSQNSKGRDAPMPAGVARTA